ncbi:serine/threonine-protein kinase [Flexivirga meconopsidis]|uniref:serine/threonine-protein kinase n=1 Tax=Flexivirga meconopsidis TaxID=2977121 RepID=UPI00223F6630
MSPQDAEPQAGARFGHYELREVIGRGGMGQVARATDTRLGRDVALKVMNLDVASHAEYRARFQREAEIVARLTDPHVIPIHGYGEIDGRLYLDMRLVKGRNLAQLLAMGQLEVSRALDILSQIADALDSAHRAGLVHRDVKPSNILVDPRGFTYLVDFGIAATPGDGDMTAEGEVVGSAAYMAPERFGELPRADARSDVYSLACVLYQALTGSKPFPASDTAAVIAAHLRTPPPSLRRYRADLPPALDRVLASGMAKRPADRPATAGELLAAAKAAMVPPRTTPAARPTPRPAEPPKSSTAPPRAVRMPQPAGPTPTPAAAPSPTPARWLLFGALGVVVFIVVLVALVLR